MFKKIFGITHEKESNQNDVEDLHAEIEVLKEEIESLLDYKENREKDIKELNFKINVLSATLREKDVENASLKEKLDSLSEKVDKPSNITEKLFQTIKDRDIIIDNLKLENENLRKSLVLNNKNSPSLFDFDLANYKLLIKDYYEARKFEDFKKICQEKDLFYVEDLYNIDFDTLNLTKTKIKNAKSLFDDYIDRNFDINISTYLLKGALISEFFFRFRSFVNYCKKNNLFYIIDLDDFDFQALLRDGFSEDQLEKIQSAYNDYNTVHKIRR